MREKGKFFFTMKFQIIYLEEMMKRENSLFSKYHTNNILVCFRQDSSIDDKISGQKWSDTVFT